MTRSIRFGKQKSFLLLKQKVYTLFINGGTRGRVWVEYMKVRRKGLLIQMKTKQSMEMQEESLVILEISCQLGSDSCLLMTTIELPAFTTADMVVWFRSQPKKMGKCYRKTASIFSVSSLLSRVQF